MRNNTKKGFTLVELIVVIVIIGILAAVLIPSFTSYVDRANKSKDEQEARSYVIAYLSVSADPDATGSDGVLSSEEYLAALAEFQLASDKVGLAITSDEVTHLVLDGSSYQVVYTFESSSYASKKLSQSTWNVNLGVATPK
jgi:type IV pilus assembly protein PilA